MPSIILSDNGVSSGSAGLKSTAASDGALALQTTTAGGTATTAVTIDRSQNVGVGVTPNAWGSGWTGLQFGPSGSAANSGTGTPVTAISNNAYYNGTNWVYINTAAAAQYQLSTSQHIWRYAASNSGNITWSEAMRLDASGNLLVGTTTPFLNASGRGLINVNGSSSSAIAFGVGGTRTGHIYTDTFELAIANNNGANGYIALQTNGAERARIDSSGNLLVATASAIGSGSNTSQNTTLATTYSWFATNDSVYIQRPNNTNGSVLTFFRGATNVGSITVTASATAYNTSSDYRLKENIAPMTGALTKVAALKPVTYTWKADGSTGEGFIAHELQAVVPDCVTGEKDAVDADGNPVYQGIDTSFLVATLTAAIQELKAEFDAYKATHP